MSNQLCFEDIEVGTEIPALVKHVTTKQLVKWAGASEDFFEIHYDKDFAVSQSLPDVIIHGRLKAAFLGQMLTDWIGDNGLVKKISCRYLGIDVPRKPLTCKGRVIRKFVANNENCVECEIWTENLEGQKTTMGNAVVALPNRNT